VTAPLIVERKRRVDAKADAAAQSGLNARNTQALRERADLLATQTVEKLRSSMNGREFHFFKEALLKKLGKEKPQRAFSKKPGTDHKALVEQVFARSAAPNSAPSPAKDDPALDSAEGGE
jgi:hypothetical protein